MLIKDKLVSDKDGMIHLASQPLDYDQLSKLTVDNEAIKEKKVVIDSNYFTLTDKRTVTSDEDQGNTYLFPGTYVLKETQAPKGYVASYDIEFEVPVNKDKSDDALVIQAENKKKPESTPEPTPHPVPTDNPQPKTEKSKPKILAHTGSGSAVQLALVAVLASIATACVSLRMARRLTY
ncbi:prealbumin-like fold domain-containing protein [Alloscardovia omnicolens]|uniref:prealbumin-like fold domain-containing protein n=1 Tax=Alloscardovia omnicolens TaxID=419015 RepID=UPI00254A9791|nr:prealbumin-like fold domain-containing protein [Alloscardovia omnicolens]MDK6249742.1 prealbumin-like fold domain-containing protein [Alloscardovia omnicolens]MDK6251573.1 prealbumin-like fold domain-containing protein [Alloscardovia omnicolens]